MLPAHAGMILHAEVYRNYRDHVTRTRGDDPAYNAKISTIL